jgi:divalent metal cation (Fe/Co/Zn/Cd) transporter
MDAVPKDMVDRAQRAVRAVPGVEAVQRIRMRKTGGEWFADVVIEVASELTIGEAHTVTEAVEQRLSELLPGGDIVVHAEPVHVQTPTQA